MFKTDHFSDLLCPIDNCKRAHCNFWHNPEGAGSTSGAVTNSTNPSSVQNVPMITTSPSPQYNPASYSNYSSEPTMYSASFAQPSSSSSIGQVSNESAYGGGFTGYVATMYAPVEPEYTYNATMSSHSGVPSYPSYTATLGTSVHESVPQYSITMPPLNIKSEALGIQSDIPTTSSSNISPNGQMKTSQLATTNKIKSLPLPRIPVAPIIEKKAKEAKFHEYVGEVARLNDEIERLSKLKDQYRAEAKMIASASGDSQLLAIKRELSSPRNTPSPEEIREKNKKITAAAVPYIPAQMTEKQKQLKERDKLEKKKSKENIASMVSKRRLTDDQVDALFDDSIDGAPQPKKKHHKSTDSSNPQPITNDKRTSSERDNQRPGPSTKRVKIERSEEEDDSECIIIGHKTAKAKPPKNHKVLEEKKKKPSEPPVPPPPPPVRVEKGRGLTTEQLAAAKQRIARDTGLRPSEIKRAVIARKTLSLTEQIIARREAAQKEAQRKKAEEEEAAKNQPKRTLTMEEQFGQKKVGIAGSMGKGQQRASRLTDFRPGTKVKPELMDPRSTKVPLTIRMKYLDKIFQEYLNITSAVDAKHNAETEEKEILDKVSQKKSYMVAAVNVLMRIREAAKPSKSTPSSQSVSHHSVMAGRHVNDISVGVKKAAKTTNEVLTEASFRIHLSKFLMTEEQLVSNGYPRWETSEKEKVIFQQNCLDTNKKSWVEDYDMRRVCSRCSKEFNLDPKGRVMQSNCIYHYNRLVNSRAKAATQHHYPCCNQDKSTAGCAAAEAHVTDTQRMSELKKFVETPKATSDKDPRSKKIFALDCEMVYTVWGPALARVTVVDMKDELILDLKVKPSHAVVDCNTRFSGLTMDDIRDATADLAEAQNRLFEIINQDTYLIGHSLESDLKALRIVHNKVIDTAIVYPHKMGHPYKRALRNLASEILQKIIQEDVAGHDSKEDSSACMQLMLHKVKHGI